MRTSLVYAASILPITYYLLLELCFLLQQRLNLLYLSLKAFIYFQLTFYSLASMQHCRMILIADELTDF